MHAKITFIDDLGCFCVKTRKCSPSDVAMAFRKAMPYCRNAAHQEGAPLVTREYAIRAGDVAAAFVAATKGVQQDTTLISTDSTVKYDYEYIVRISMRELDHGIHVYLRVRGKPVIEKMKFDDFVNANVRARSDLNESARKIAWA